MVIIALEAEKSSVRKIYAAGLFISISARWGEKDSFKSLTFAAVRSHSQNWYNNDPIPSASHAINNSLRRCIVDYRWGLTLTSARPRFNLVACPATEKLGIECRKEQS
jgi:hypothetical protein